MKKKRDISPPKWARQFLQFYCREEYLEEIMGDIHELFEVRKSLYGSKARLMFIWDVARFFRLANIKAFKNSKINQLTMVKNNFKIAYRNLVRNKFYASINLIGISLGICCFVMTYLYVQEELSFDKFHSNYDDIYRVWIHEVYPEDDEEYFEVVVPVAMVTAMKQDFPQIKEHIQIRSIGASYISPEQKRISTTAHLVGSGFLTAFDFKLLAGDRESALSDPTSIVLTEKDALGKFGSTDVLDQTIVLEIGEGSHPFRVTGIIENPPKNSSIRYKSLISDLNNDRFLEEQTRNEWYNFSTEFYVQLNEGTEPQQLEVLFPEMVKRGLGEEYEEGAFNVHLQPLSEVHFDTQIGGDAMVGDIRMVRILGIVGTIILLLAGINFVNLAIGQSIRRAKEVGVRKVLGAFKGQLVIQFLSESFLLTLLALGFSLLLTRLLLPTFNEFAGKDLDLVFSAPLLTALGLSTLVIALLSGIYPAVVISSFKPVNALKGGILKSRSKNGLAYALIIVQFFAAIFFVSTTVIMKNQLSYLSKKDLGYESEGIVYLRLPRPENRQPGMSGILTANSILANQFLTELDQIPQVQKSAYSNNYFGDEGWIKMEYIDKEEDWHSFAYNHIGERFSDLFEIEIVKGKGFEQASDFEKRTGILINETLAKTLDVEPIGAKLPGPKFGEHSIIGVVKDFNFESLHKTIEPLVLSMRSDYLFSAIEGLSIFQSTRATVLVKTKLEDFKAVNEKMKAIWEARFAEPYEATFLDQRLGRMYEKEQKANAMTTLISILAITIASLGLLGLAALTIKNKFKEIGIRKVLGATSAMILGQLYKVFLGPILVAFVISVPVTIYAMRDWLTAFEYRIEIGVLHFGMALILVGAITVLVVSYQSARAARLNPVHTLRDE